MVSSIDCRAVISFTTRPGGSRPREASRRIEAAFGPPECDPTRSDMRGATAARDWAAASQMRRLIEHFRDRSSPLGLELRPISEPNLAEAFDRDALHPAIGAFRGAPARFVVEPFTHCEAVRAMRRRDPAAARRRRLILDYACAEGAAPAPALA